VPTEIRRALREELKPIKDRIQSIDHAIRGNGTPGLNQRVALLEQSRTVTSKLWWTIGSVIVVLLGAMGTKIIG